MPPFRDRQRTCFVDHADSIHHQEARTTLARCYPALVNPPSSIAPADPILRDAADVTETTVPVEVVTPASGQQVNRAELRFIWHSLGNQTNYRFTLTTAEGEGIWTTDTADTTLAAPPTLSMEPNLSYIWYVDALLLDGTAATSGIRRFTLTR